MIADELRRQADNFIELEDLKDVIGRPPRPDQPLEHVRSEESAVETADEED